MTPIPLIESCSGCGACCMEQGSPPGYGLILNSIPWPDRDDVKRFAALPSDALLILKNYGHDLMRGKITGEGPCCWLNLETRECRFYEHRPQICRDFERGSDGCHEWRKLLLTPAEES